MSSSPTKQLPLEEEGTPTHPEEQVAEEGEDEEEEGGDDDDEEEEPQLKYERIGGDVAKVVKGDLVSSFCVGSKVIVSHFLSSLVPYTVSKLTIRIPRRSVHIMAKSMYSI